MNTTKKGNAFRDLIYSIFERDIKNDNFHYKSEHCEIDTEKKYRARPREISFDVAIEIYRRPRDKRSEGEAFSQLILIECKDYEGRVPVREVEKFAFDVVQIRDTGLSVKGIFITKNAYQDGVYNTCREYGIALARYVGTDTLQWELERSASAGTEPNAAEDAIQIHRGLTEEHFTSHIYDIYGYSGGTLTNSLWGLIENLFGADLLNEEWLEKIKNSEKNLSVVPYIPDKGIEAIVNRVLKSIGYSGGEVPIRAICELESQRSGLGVHYVDPPDGLARTVLGKLNFNPFEILLFKQPGLRTEGARFTAAHELGHYFLGHHRYMRGEWCHQEDIDLDSRRRINAKDIRTMEIQANRFASFLLLPRAEVIATLAELLDRRGISPRGVGLYLDNQPGNRDNYMRITGAMMKKFKVSRTVIERRLKYLRLLQDDRLKSMRRPIQLTR